MLNAGTAPNRDYFGAPAGSAAEVTDGDAANVWNRPTSYVSREVSAVSNGGSSPKGCGH